MKGSFVMGNLSWFYCAKYFLASAAIYHLLAHSSYHSLYSKQSCAYLPCPSQVFCSQTTFDLCILFYPQTSASLMFVSVLLCTDNLALNASKPILIFSSNSSLAMPITFLFFPINIGIGLLSSFKYLIVWNLAATSFAMSL